MAISGLSEYGGMYNNYKVVDIPKVDFETVKEQDELKVSSEQQAIAELSQSLQNQQAIPDNRSRSADLENISLTFNTGDDYSYLGTDSSIENLDIQKAISDMRKDQVLEEYQYFVGSSDEFITSLDNEDGKVIMKF